MPRESSSAFPTNPQAINPCRSCGVDARPLPCSCGVLACPHCNVHEPRRAPLELEPLELDADRFDWRALSPVAPFAVSNAAVLRWARTSAYCCEHCNHNLLSGADSRCAGCGTSLGDCIASTKGAH